MLTELCKIFPVYEVVCEIVKANGSKSFSPVMVGQNRQIERISKTLPVNYPRRVGDFNNTEAPRPCEKREKAEESPQTHAVDGVAPAATNLLSYKPFVKANEHGYLWQGECAITEAPFSVIRRPQFFCHKLRVENPAKGGIRKCHGRTTIPYGFRKGDFVEAEKAGIKVRGFVSGYSEANGVISIADHCWRRIDQFVASKVRLLWRSSRLLVEHQNCVSI